MKMENQRYLQEGLDIKKLLLLMKRKLWIPLVAMVAGALAGGGLYLLFHLVLLPEREYQAVGKYYLHFNCEPEDYNQLSYNGYTWNDLMDTDPILDYMMEQLSDKVDRETVAAATEAEILSDIRLLTVTVTTPTPQLTTSIIEAVGASLVHLGETDELFRGIEIYGVTEAAQILWDNRTQAALVTGAVLAFVVSVMVLAFYYVLDDSLYVEQDVQRSCGLPVMGMFAADGRETGWGKVFCANYAYLCGQLGQLALLGIEGKEKAVQAEAMIRKVWLEGGSGEAVGEQTDTSSVVESGLHPANLSALEPVGLPETEEDYQRLRQKEGILLVIRFGGRNGRVVRGLLHQLKLQDCQAVGVVITEADRQFCQSYYHKRLRENS